MDAITELAGAAPGGLLESVCDQCDGHGEYPVEDDRGVERYIACSRCDGTGWVAAKPLPLVTLGQGDYTTTIEE